MSIATLPAPIESSTSTGRVSHVVCCDDDVAMCGENVAGRPFLSEDGPVDCVVCADLEDGPCSAPDCPDRVTA